MQLQISIVYLLICFCSVYSLHLPKYIKSCKVREADFKACAIKNGNDAFKTLLKGDPKYNIPPADPIIFPSATVVSDNVNLNSTNISLHGLTDSVLTDVDVNLEKQTISFEIHVPLMFIQFNYQIKGKISAFAIDGNGPGSMKIDEGTFRMSFGFNITEKKGKRYMNLEDKSFDFNAQKITFNFENLLRGNKALENQLLAFLNENWRDVVEATRPSFTQIGYTLWNLIVGTVLQRVPVDEIFPDF